MNKSLHILCLLAALFTNIFGAPMLTRTNAMAITSRDDLNEEHIVIVDKSQTDCHEVLSRLDLNPSHPNVHHTWSNKAFHGFAARMEPQHLDSLANMSDILHVERATLVHSQSTVTVRDSSPWGLQRISSSSYMFGDPESLTYKYTYSASNLGSGVDIYVVDTGINVANTVFTGRARMGWSYESNSEDQDGHGTHVSGTAAGAIFGVASDANIIGVKALGDDGSGTSTNSIAALDWVVNQHSSRKSQSGFVGSVMSLSWGLSSLSPSIQTAVTSAIGQGVHVSIAAGNSGGDACTASPSAAGGTNSAAIVVGSVDETSTISSFSNTGPCVDVYAPGEDVLSAWIGGPNVLNYLSGTSMACPHVTGTMAYLMATNPDLASSPTALKAEIVNMALKSTLKGGTISGDHGLLVNNGMLGSVGGESEATLLE